MTDLDSEATVPPATDGEGRQDGLPGESAMSTAIQELRAATRSLHCTIRSTEELAESRAELLRTAGASVGMERHLRSDGHRAGIVSLAEAARRSGRNPEVLRRWCQEGRIPAIRVGRTWAITMDTLAMLIEHRHRARPRLPRDGVRA